jgi:hypothetical protein
MGGSSRKFLFSFTMAILTFQGINAISLIISAENYKNIDIIFNTVVLHHARPETALSETAYQRKP